MQYTRPLHRESFTSPFKFKVGEGSALGVTVAEINSCPRILNVFKSISIEVFPIVTTVAITVAIVGSGMESDALSPV